MRSSELKLTILHKGLILLLVPFALQATLFLMLFAEISATERFAEKLRNRTDVLEKSNALVEDFGLAWTTIFTQLFSANRAREAPPLSAEAYRVRVSHNLAVLNAVPQISPRMKQILKDAAVVCNSQYKILKRVEAEQEKGSMTGPGAFALLDQFYSLKSDLARTFAQMNAIKAEMDFERQEVRRDGEITAQKRSSVKQLSIVFLLSELLLTGALLAFFLRNISRRLNVLVSNARRLPEEERLSDHVEGRDEIAYLDSVLHEASEKLLASKQNRQSILNMITHDIRSPLMSSNLLLDSLVGKAQSTGDADSMETGERLKNTYKKVILLVEDLLLLEKSDAKLKLNPQVIDVETVCQSAIETALPQAKSKGINLENLVEPCQLIADKMRIEQVLSNLLSNAVKHTSKGGSIVLSSEKTAEYLTISVKDKGAGIDADEVPHLFEKFFQSRNAAAGEGFGLGLAIAKMVIDGHDGKIGVESEVGKGSTFWFSLPLEG